MLKLYIFSKLANKNACYQVSDVILSGERQRHFGCRPQDGSRDPQALRAGREFGVGEKSMMCVTS